MEKINCFINNFNLLTWPKAMVEYLLEIPELNVIIIDNNTTYKPTLDWYKTKPCEIIELGENLGHHAPFTTNLVDLGSNDYYIVTDPDLELNKIPKDFLNILIKGMENYKHNCKVGFSIEIDDIPNRNIKYDRVYNDVKLWESQFWVDKIPGTLFYNAPIDTTFAIYSKARGGNNIGMQTGIRTDRPYTCRHLPFYIDENNITEELCFYYENANSSSSRSGLIYPIIKKFRDKNKVNNE